MRRKRRRPERAEEERQLMSNSLLDDLITPSHLATGVGWGFLFLKRKQEHWKKISIFPTFSVKFGVFKAFPVQRCVSHGGKRRLNQHRLDLITLETQKSDRQPHPSCCRRQRDVTNVDTLLSASLCPLWGFFPDVCSLACP